MRTRSKKAAVARETSDVAAERTSVADETASVSELTQQIETLKRENVCLLRQLHIVANEYDELKTKVTQNQKANTKRANSKMKEKHTPQAPGHTYEGNTDRNVANLVRKNCDCDSVCRDEMNRCTNIIIEALFDEDIISTTTVIRPAVVNNAPEPKCTDKTRRKHNNAKRHPMGNRGKEDTPRVIAIGTSLVRELYLRSAGLNGITYCYPGQHVNYIRSRVPHILKDEQPSVIYLQCAGNDIERYQNHHVIKEYEGLIRDIKELSPQSTLILGAVPLRGRDKSMHTRIRMFNTYLFNRGRWNDNVEYLYAAPKQLSHFKKDLLHFNAEGAIVFQNNIVKKVQHFYSFPRLPTIQHI